MPTGVRTIQQARARIHARIRKIEDQLEGLEGVPASQPWITYRWVTDPRELASRFPSLKEALRADLASLRQELAHLRRQEVRMQRRLAQQNADRMDREFRDHLRQALKEAERSGSLDDGTFDELLDESEEVLEAYATNLERNPSTQGMKGVLHGLEAFLALGGDTDRGAGDRAMASLQRGGTELRNRAERQFRVAPSSQNFRKYLDATATSLMVGGEGVTDRPPGLRKVKMGDRHRVAPGDTLSRLAREYYGNPAHWDVIYLANVGVIEHPDRLTVGVELRIP